jgi:uncharacterized protein YbaP (TraB family)
MKQAMTIGRVTRRFGPRCKRCSISWAMNRKTFEVYSHRRNTMDKRYVPATLLIALSAFALSACSSVESASPAPQASKTFLWKVTSAHRIMYLTGNTQGLSAHDYPLPAPMTKAFGESTRVVFEGSPSANKAKVKALVMKLGPLPQGEKLGEKISAAQLKRVKKAFAKVGVPFAAMQGMRPWIAGTVLQGKSLMKLWDKVGAKKSDQINQYFYKKAKARSLPITVLQPTSDIIKMLAAFPEKVQVAWLMMNAKSAAKPFKMDKYEKLLRAWENGDTKVLAHFSSKTFGDRPELYKAAVTDRNRRWVKSLEAMLAKRGKPVFVIVGAGHLVGHGNMRAMLRQDGYRVTQL